MKTTTAAFLFMLSGLVVACERDHCDDETCSGGTGTTTTSDTTSSATTTDTGVGGEGGSGGSVTTTTHIGGGGTGGGVAGCPEDLLAYDPDSSYSNPIGPHTDEFGGFFGGRVAPFDVDTVCTHIIVGLAEFSNPSVCSLPATIGVDAWSEVGVADPMTGALLPVGTPPALETMFVADAEHSLFAAASDAHVYKFAAPRSFKAGEPVFVALQLEQFICALGTTPACDTTASLRYRPQSPGMGWALLSDADDDAPPQVPDVKEQLLFGLGNCSAQ